jgi:hypothetical protein
MSFLIVIRFDSAGACPIVAREDDELFSSDGARWRLVAQTDDPLEAARLVELLRQRSDLSELVLDEGSGSEAISARESRARNPGRPSSPAKP